jgi:hypothetical protein
MSSDPNADASPESVADQVAGTNVDGVPLTFEEAAMLYPAHMFGLSRDYAFPEASNTSPGMADHVTTLTKLETRLAELADGNTYDFWDMVRTNTKWILAQDIHINDDEPLSVNYVPPAAAALMKLPWYKRLWRTGSL